MHRQYKRRAYFPIGPSIAYIKLSSGDYALVDREDASTLHRWSWNLSSRRYASNKVIGKMHRFLLGYPPCLVDHRNGKELHNWKGNLREATNSQNIFNSKTRSDNSSKMKGVRKVPRKSGHKWMARIAINGKMTHLGTFLTPSEAQAAYWKAAQEYAGEFARA